MEYPLVSIITVNYNQPAVTCELISSLRKISYPNTEIIVVDNASPDTDPTVIKKSFPEITLVINKMNSGFAGGNNAGIRHAHGKYLLFLNNDTEVAPDFLEPLVSTLEAHPGIGAVSPQIRFFDQPDTLQFAGFSGINPYTVRGRGLGWHRKDEGQFDKDITTAYVHGAAMIVPFDVIRKVGLMAECYFLYYEELDWSNRIKQEGYSLWYVHDSVVYHKESVSTGKMSASKVYYMNRARLLYMRRNIHGLKFLTALLFMILVSFPVNAFRYLVKRKSGYFGAYKDAILWHVKHFSSKEIYIDPTL